MRARNRPPTVARDTSWVERAACRGRSTDLWFPSGGSSDAYSAALLICRRCPVRSECLDDALATEQAHARHGIRGGLTPTGRKNIARLFGRKPVVEPVYMFLGIDEVLCRTGVGE